MARYEANADFQRDYYKRRKLAARSLGNDNEVSVICFPHKLTIVLEGCKNEAIILYTALENFTLQSKGAHFEKIRLRAYLFSFAALCTVQHGLYTSNLLTTPMHMSNILFLGAQEHN